MFKSNDQLKQFFVSIVTQNTIYHFSIKKGKLSMCDMDVNSSDISEVFSDSDSLSSFDNEASGFYFNKLEYTEQVLRKYMTRFSSEEISNTK